MADRVARFDQRLAALASGHALLVQSDWTGADFGTLVTSQLAPYVSDHPERLITEGAPVFLPPDLAAPFGLVLHELATNAAKHGALSQQTGTVRVDWSVAERPGGQALVTTWTESGGPKVSPPTSTGLGSVLIQSAVPGAVVTRDYRADGLVCRIEVPLPAAA